MSITSVMFLALSIPAALIYRFLPQKYRNLWLLIISMAFVFTWSWVFVLILAFFGLMNFLFGIRLSRHKNQRIWLISGIVLNIFFLLFIKYNQFFLPSFLILVEKIGWSINQDFISILVPVGLSFLVVQAVSYLLDVSNKRMNPELDLVNFGVYIFYFPKMLSGPVERARLFLPKLEKPLPFDRPLLEKSIALLSVGLLRKLLIADPLFTMIPANAFISPRDYAGQHLFFWVLAYAFALYNDFAGYTSIIRSVSLWFGIDLTNNFNLPYLSRNFTEFWTRWHISLSNWLRDYIYFPLSRRLMRRFPERNYFLNIVIPPMITLFVSGLWHGLSWNLVVWGCLHGLYLVFERIASIAKPLPPPDEQPKWLQSSGVLVTFILTVIAWIPFKMSIPVSVTYFSGLFNWVKPDFWLLKQYLLGNTEMLSWSSLNLPNPLLIFVIAFAILFDLLLCRKGSEKELTTLPQWLQILVLVIAILAVISSIFTDISSPFVYQGF